MHNICTGNARLENGSTDFWSQDSLVPTLRKKAKCVTCVAGGFPATRRVHMPGTHSQGSRKKSWESSTRPISQSNRLCQRHHRFLVGLFCWSASSREQAPERYCPNTSVVDPVVREKFRLRRLCFLGSNDSRLCTMAQGAVKKSKAAAPKKYVRCRTISTVLGALLMSNS